MEARAGQEGSKCSANRVGRRREVEKLASAATELTPYSCSDGNSSHFLTSDPNSPFYGLLCGPLLQESPGHLGLPGSSLAPASGCLTSSYPGSQAPASSTVCTGWGMGAAKEGSRPLQPRESNISCGTRAGGPGLEGPDTGTWAQKNRAFLFSFSTAHGCVF